MHSRQRTIDDMMRISDGHNPYHYIKGGMIGGMAKRYGDDTVDIATGESKFSEHRGINRESGLDKEYITNAELNNELVDAIANKTDYPVWVNNYMKDHNINDPNIILEKLDTEALRLEHLLHNKGWKIPEVERKELVSDSEEESENEEKEPEESENEEKEPEESKSESEEEEEEKEEIPIIPLVENSGYYFYNNLKKEYKINLANGLGWEKITVEVPSVQKPIKEYTDDNTPIVPQTDYYFNKLAPTEAIYKYWEKNKIAGRFPWEYIPCDLSNESTNIESKNYIKTQIHDPGRYIDNKKYLEIQEALKAGKTVDEIEKDLGKDIPYINITKSKLTSINKAGYSNVFRQKFKEENGKIYMDKVLYNGYYPNKEGTSVTKVYEKPIWEGKKGFIYDLLYDNARVIYDPLKDTNLKLIKDNRKNPKDSLPLYGSFDTSKYKTIIENNEEFILVPITRCKIIPLK